VHQATSVPEVNGKTKRPKKAKSIPATIGKVARELGALQQSATLDEADRAYRKEHLVKLFRVGFRGIEKSIGNHPSYTEDDLTFFKEEGFNV